MAALQICDELRLQLDRERRSNLSPGTTSSVKPKIISEVGSKQGALLKSSQKEAVKSIQLTEVRNLLIPSLLVEAVENVKLEDKTKENAANSPNKLVQQTESRKRAKNYKFSTTQDLQSTKRNTSVSERM